MYYKLEWYEDNINRVQIVSLTKLRICKPYGKLKIYELAMKRETTANNGKNR